MKGKGWYKESERHSAAARGISTGRTERERAGTKVRVVPKKSGSRNPISLWWNKSEIEDRFSILLDILDVPPLEAAEYQHFSWDELPSSVKEGMTEAWTEIRSNQV